MTTKDQERKALEQIKKIIDGLGADSYVSAAMEGVYDLAMDNIGNDFCISFPEKIERLEKEIAEYKQANAENMAKAAEAERVAEQARAYADEQTKEIGRLAGALRASDEELARLEVENDSQGAQIGEQAREIVELKARLYDLMTAEV